MGRDKGVVVQTTTPDTGVLKAEEGSQYKYIQPLAENMGIRVGSNVAYQPIDSGKDTIAASVILLKNKQQRGTIDTINADGESGWLTDKQDQRYPFRQPFLKELGLAVGSKCRFTLVNDKGTDTAVSLILFVKRSKK